MTNIHTNDTQKKAICDSILLYLMIIVMINAVLKVEHNVFNAACIVSMIALVVILQGRSERNILKRCEQGCCININS